MENADAGAPQDSRYRRTQEADDHLPLPGKAYHPLNRDRKEIRLLIVQPGVGNEPVCCSFQQGFLTDDPKPVYETISYVWGDDKVCTTLYLEGQVIKVPVSSERALRRMRLPDRNRALWLDALCINQPDLPEKNQQVAIMGEIYASTATNLIWLGEDDGFTQLAIRSIEALYKEMMLETEGGRTFLDTAYPAGEIELIFSKKSVVSANDDAVESFLNSTWFERLWVCQEASLAPHSICHRGDYEVPLEMVLRTTLWLAHRARSKESHERAKIEQSAVVQEAPTSPEQSVNVFCALRLAEWADPVCGYNRLRLKPNLVLLKLMMSSREFKVKDPRDHVFAVLGQLRQFSGVQELPRELVPDYQKSLADVLQGATKCIIREQRALTVLQYVCHRRQDSRQEGFATWVPRWDRPVNPLEDPLTFVHVDQCADDKRPWDLDLALSTPNVLIVSAHLLGTVQQPSNSFEHFDSNGWHLQKLELLEQMMENSRYCIAPELFRHVEEFTQAGAIGISGSNDRPLSGRLYLALKEHLHSSQYYEWPHDFAEEEMISFVRAFETACFYRSLFETSTRYLGLGPQTMQAGDALVVVYGSALPLILRPICSQTHDYECVGVAYVYGIMNGEALRGSSEAPVLLRVH